MTRNGAAIEARELSKTYGGGVRALDGLGFTVEAGTVLGLLGPVDRGRVVASGSPNELKGELRGDAIQVELGDPEPDGRAHAALDRVSGVWEVTVEGRSLRAQTGDGSAAVPAVLQALEAGGERVASVTIARPSLDDVYLRHTGRSFAKVAEEASR